MSFSRSKLEREQNVVERRMNKHKKKVEREKLFNSQVVQCRNCFVTWFTCEFIHSFSFIQQTSLSLSRLSCCVRKSISCWLSCLANNNNNARKVGVGSLNVSSEPNKWNFSLWSPPRPEQLLSEILTWQWTAVPSATARRRRRAQLLMTIENILRLHIIRFTFRKHLNRRFIALVIVITWMHRRHCHVVAMLFHLVDW